MNILHHVRTSLLAMATMFFFSAAVAQAAVSGVVYRELPMNGDTANTYGVKDVNERGVAGVTVTAVDTAGNSGSTVTAADGSWTIGGLSGLVRVEFSDWPAHLSPSPKGDDSDTGVQFVADGATDVNLGLFDIGEYFLPNPRLISIVLPVDSSGRPDPYAPSKTNPVISSWLYDDKITSASPNQVDPHDQDIKYGQAGALFGLAVQRKTGKLIYSAMASPLWETNSTGIGGIYMADYTTGTDNQFTPGSANLLIDLTSSVDLSNQRPVDASEPNRFGEYGIGGLAFSADENDLYAVNMGGGSLVRMTVGVPAATPSAITEIDIPDPGCNNGVYRPSTLTRQGGLFYIGGICDGSAGSDADVEAVVQTYDPIAGTFGTALRFPFDFNGGGIWDTGYPAVRWQNSSVDGGNFVQPVLTSLVFDDTGSMILGFMPRLAYNGLPQNYPAGYLVRANLNSDGSFTLESGGVSGPLTSAARRVPPATPPTPSLVPVSDGPGGGWFFEQSINTAYAEHPYLFSSGLAVLPGSGQVVASFADPLNYDSFGVRYFNSQNGQTEAGFNLGGFKAALLGDLEILSDPAPLQIGNRVWRDEGSGNAANDNNGIQDPGEPGIAGVVVTLSVVVNGTTYTAQTTTDANGNYYFTDGEGEVATNFPDGVIPRNNTTAVISIGEYQTPLNGLKAVSADVGGNDLIDSDGLSFGGQVSYAIPNTGYPGQNNHSYDFGFAPPGVSLGDYIWLDLDADGEQDATEPPLAGVTVELFFTPDDGTTLNPAVDAGGVAISPQTVGVDGKYLFTNLPEGDYVVRVTPPGGQVPTPIQQPDPDQTDNTDSNFDLTRTPPSGSYESGVVTLALGTEDGDGNADDNYNQSVDFGFVPTLSLGDFVWNDLDADGEQDADEPPLAGVELALFEDDGAGNFVPARDVFGQPVNNQITDENGKYLFDKLLPGIYRVEVIGDNWQAGGVFASGGDYDGFVGTVGSGADNQDNTDDNGDNDGLSVPGSIRSVDIALDFDDEPTDDGDGDNNSDLTVDFGFYGYNLGNFVWLDVDNSGSFDSGETPLAGVEVELLDGSGNSIDSNPATPDMEPTVTFTDVDGRYLFEGLAAGDYRVRIGTVNFVAGGILSGLVPSTGGGREVDPDIDGDQNSNGLINGDPSYPGDPTANGVVSGVVTLGGSSEPTGENPDNSPVTMPDNRSNLTVDFGFFAPVSVGDRVWEDINVNGRQDGAELPLAGVTVELFFTPDDGITLNPAVDVNGNTVSAQTTDINGLYRFDNLLPGDYVLRITAPSGTSFIPTMVNQPDPDQTDNTDSNFDLTRTPPSGSYESGVVTLTVGEEVLDGDTDDNHNPSVDFGFFRPMSVGNRVWLDADRNGYYDAGEIVLAGVTLGLTMDDGSGSFVPAVDADGNPVVDRVTDALGRYTFTNLLPGRYRITVLPENWVTGPFSPGQTLAGALGTITTGSDNQINDDNSGDNPDIPNPPQGISSGVIVLTAGSEPVLEDPVETLPDSNSDLTIDFGIYSPVGLGNRVWLDKNADGIQNDNEIGIAGVTLELLMNDGTGNFVSALNAQGLAVPRQITDVNGNYIFDNLRPGEYRVRILPDNWQAGGVFGPGEIYEGAVGTVGGGADNQDNSDDNGNNDHTVSPVDGIVSGTITLRSQTEPVLEDVQEAAANADTDLTVDFGVYVPVAVGDRVWLDTDGDGQQDDDEVGIADVTLSIRQADGSPALDVAGNPVGTRNTSSDGFYKFDNLRPGRYIISVEGDNWQAGGVFGPGGEYEGAFGTIGGIDDNNDNRDNTDDNGDNDFAVVPARINSEPIEIHSLNEPTDDGDGDNNSDLTVDFGFVTPVAVGNFVWYDRNVNGIQDENEPGIAGIELELLQRSSDGEFVAAEDASGNKVSSRLTDDEGKYLFDNLLPGEYRVRILPENWQAGGVFGPGGEYEGAFGTVGNGGDDAVDTDDNGDRDYVVAPAGGVTSRSFVLRSAGEPVDERDTSSVPNFDTDLTIDFGFARGMDLGNRVWLDKDNDGKMDADEKGIDGVKVEYYKMENGKYVLAGSTITTDGGYYFFNDLPPGDYVVVLPADNFDGSLKGLKSSGTEYDGDEKTAPDPDNDPRDRDDNGMLQKDGQFKGAVIAKTITLSPDSPEPTGESDKPSGFNDPTLDVFSNLTVDFGFYEPASLGNYVWIDGDGDGKQDASEKPIKGVKVKLYDEDGKRLDETKTDKKGKYIFKNLPPGRYYVKFELPDGYKFTVRGQGNHKIDSDAKVDSGKTQKVELISGQYYKHLDAGLVAPKLAQTGQSMLPGLFGGVVALFGGVVILWFLRRPKEAKVLVEGAGEFSLKKLERNLPQTAKVKKPGGSPVKIKKIDL